MITALEAISRLGRRGNYALNTIFTCAMNADATSRVVIKALIAYGNITNLNGDPTVSIQILRRQAVFDTDNQSYLAEHDKNRTFIRQV